jgi:hypothetical protein
MIVCGWCGQPTTPGPACASCGRDPALPWTQRGLFAPLADKYARERRLLAEAERDIRGQGLEPSADRLAERLGIDARSVRRWQANVRPAS